MEFNFDDVPPALIQQKKKYSTFTVRTIGGPEDLARWRKEQEAKEFAYRVRLGQRDDRLKAYESEIGVKLTTPTIHTSTWEEKKAFAESERLRLKQVEDRVSEFPPWEVFEAEKTPLKQRIKRFIANIWKLANF